MIHGYAQGSICGPTFWNTIYDDLLDITLPEDCGKQAFTDNQAHRQQLVQIFVLPTWGIHAEDVVMIYRQ